MKLNTLYRIIGKNIIWDVSEKLDRNLNLTTNGMSVNRSVKDKIKVLFILPQMLFSLYLIFKSCNTNLTVDQKVTRIWTKNKLFINQL